MIRRHPRSTRTDPPFPYPPLFRSDRRRDARCRRLDRKPDPARRDARRQRDRRDRHPRRAGTQRRCGARQAPRLTEPRGRADVDADPGLNPVREPRPTLERVRPVERHRSEEHTSELQSLMRISYAVFCLKKKKKKKTIEKETTKPITEETRIKKR